MNRGESLTLESIVAAKPGLVAAPMDDKLVMLDLAQGKYFGLDDVAAAIWAAVAAPVRVGDLCAQLTERYAVDPETCRADTLDFLNQLRAEGLLEVHE
jgi:hypothetical protein